jgi:hypothetical protein
MITKTAGDSMVILCGELDYLTSKVFCNLTDFGAKCERCETISTITLENGELKKQE